MTTCHSCCKSYAVPTDDFGGTALLCRPDGDRREKSAGIPCLKYSYELAANKLSPWFQPSDPPERDGRYQVKDWIGHIHYAEYWRGEWREPETYNRIQTHRIRYWRGVTK